MVNGISGAVYKGYPSMDAATAAYEDARANGTLKSTNATATPKKNKPYYNARQPLSPTKTPTTHSNSAASTSASTATPSSSITSSSSLTTGPSAVMSSESSKPWYLVKSEAIKNRKRWIVVFKGTDIGVFEDWLEAADYAVGIEGAVWNGFYSQGQAERAFDDALVDGFVEMLPPT